MALLEVQGLVKFFGRRQVVKGVSFEVHAGEVVGLLGPNGAGKTTSFRMATGQLTPNAGRVLFNGEDVTHLPMYQRARRGMGYLSQEPSVFRKLTVEQNLLAILEALPKSRTLGRPLTRAERRQRTNAALQRFKLEHVRHNLAARCSGGEKRRLEIARCLVCEPLLILLDEPFAAVDPLTTEDIRHNIRELARSGIGILITDHNVREVFRTADRVYLITDGQVVTHGTPHQLVNDEIAIKAYLGRSFEEDGFTRQMAAHAVRKAGAVLAQACGAACEATEPYKVGSATAQSSEQVGQDRDAEQLAAELLALERLRAAVEALRDDQALSTATLTLIQGGPRAMPLLLDALERPELLIRQRAFEVLRYLVRVHGPREEGEPILVPFDPAGPPELRRRQLAFLRLRLSA
ncbi:MAG: LPS export ABC transporter ATP-binding protein [Thermogemmata sp.]|nr:LPS export ABC transporter ATP-binding protein [Thermogemmata sp.]